MTERFQYLLLAVGGSFGASHGVAGTAIHGAQLQNILFAEVGDGAIESGDTSDALAQVSGDLQCDAFVGRLAHQAQRLLDAALGDKAQERRLFKLHRQTLTQRIVEHRIVGAIGKVGEDDGVFGVQGGRAPWIKVQTHGYNRDGQKCGGGKPPAFASHTLKPPTSAASGARRARDVARGLLPEALEIGADVCSFLVAQLTVFLERDADDFFQLRGNLFVQASGGSRRLVENRFVNHSGCVAGKGEAAGGHFIEHRAEGEQVSAGIEFLAASLLGRHIGNGADGRSRTGEQRGFLGCRHSGNAFVTRNALDQTKIEDLGVALLGDEDVRRLDGAVNDSSGMSGGESIGDFNAEIEKLIE